MSTMEILVTVVVAIGVLFLLGRVLLPPSCPKCQKRNGVNFAQEDENEHDEVDVYYCRGCDHSFALRKGVFRTRYYPGHPTTRA